MRRQVGDHPGTHVRGRADLQRDAPSAQLGHQLRVFEAADAMADALGSESVDRVPDRLRAGHLPRVRHAVQAGVPGDLEGPGELRPRHLGTAEPQADESGGPMAQHQLHGLDGKLGPTAVDVGALDQR
jgi:hypothetical protein